MGEKVKTNLYIEAETDRKLEKIAEFTFRGKNSTLDWLVAEAYERLFGGKPAVNLTEKGKEDGQVCAE